MVSAVFSRLTVLFSNRDSEIRNSVVRRVDPLAGECLGAMLKLSYKVSDPWAPVMNVVTAAEIRDQLKNLKYLDQYLKIIGKLLVNYFRIQMLPVKQKSRCRSLLC